MDGYTALSAFYDKLNYDCDYDKWSQYLLFLLKKHGAKKGLDIGCGTGRITAGLFRGGMDVMGVDISPQMLTAATEYAAKERLPIRFAQGDLRTFHCNGKQDFVTVVNDGVNYLNAADLLRAFKNVHGLLKKGGVFAFDISTCQKLSAMDGNLYYDDSDDVTYFWQNTKDGNALTMDLTFFVKSKDGKYSRFDEQHVQYLHSHDDILTALSKAGFVNVRTHEMFTENPFSYGDREQFICLRG